MRLLFTSFLLFISFAVSGQKQELAQSYFRNGEYEKAILLYEPLHKSNPIRQDYFKALLTCYQQLEDYEKAQKLLEEQLHRFPNQLYLHVEIGYNYQLQGLDEIAKKEYEKAINAIHMNPGLGYMIGRTFRENHLLDYALESYQLAKKLNPKLNTEISEAQIYGEKGDLEKMFSLYLDLIDKNENYYSTIQRYVGYFITTDSQDPINLLFKKLLLKRAQSDPKDSWNILLSWLFMQQQDFDKALVQEKSLYLRNPGNFIRIKEIGIVAYENNDLETAKACFQYILKKNDAEIADFDIKLQADIYLLKIERDLGNKGIGLEKIQKRYKELLAEYGLGEDTIELQMAYAHFLTYDFDQPDEAIERLRSILRLANSDFDKGMIQIEIADVLVFTDQFNQALILYTKVQRNLKNSNLAQEARYKVARTSYFKGDFQWAQSQLKVLKSSTSQLIANDALELSLKIGNNMDKDSLNEGLKKYAKADLLSFQKKNLHAIDTLSYVLMHFKGKNIEDDALFKQAELYWEVGMHEAAENNFLNLLENHPESLFTDDSIYKLGQLYQNHLNKPERAKEMYERIIFEFPSSIYLVKSRKAYRKLRGDDL
jgi:tetratricopeptide (TPR) repeat protein